MRQEGEGDHSDAAVIRIPGSGLGPLIREAAGVCLLSTRAIRRDAALREASLSGVGRERPKVGPEWQARNR